MATLMNDEQLEFDLGADEKATDVAIQGEQDGDKGGDTAAAPASDDQQQNNQSDTRNELESVNDAVQRRISKLTARMREAERREQAAIEYAKGLQTQTQTLQQKLVQTDYSRLTEAKARLDTQQTALRQIIMKAREENDMNTELEAQERLAALVQEQRQVAGWLQDQPQPNQQQVQQQHAPQQQQYQQPAPQQQQPQQPRPSAKAEDWATRNEWYGKNRMLTYGAWGIHQTLVEEEGVEPDSEEYYTELDRRLREEFPKHFTDTQQQSRQQRSAPAVAPASRSSGINSARRTVRLSPSQVAIAKKLGVPLEEYAKYVKE